MPLWAWVVVGIAVVLTAAKAYDWNAKRQGHRPGDGTAPQVDLTHYQRGIDNVGGMGPGGATGG